jgi:sugar/nucleoside kinase (ribokinase family)
MTEDRGKLDTGYSILDTRCREGKAAAEPYPASRIQHPASSIQFVAIGHLVHDVAECGLILGGAAAYSSIAARRLGLNAGVVSAVGEDFCHYEKLDGISLALVDCDSSGYLTTTFANIYDERGMRRQILKSVSLPIRPEYIPSEWLDAEIIYLCPVAAEVDPSIAYMFPNSLIGVSPQGWMRQWDADGQVSPRKWKDAPNVLPHVDVLVMSEEDISPFPEVVHEYVDLAEIMVLTRGERGSTLFHDGQVIDFPAFSTYTVDPTGAGDVFAVAFLTEFHRTGDLYKASVFANCTASFVVEKQGTEGIPDLDRVRSRMMSCV